MAQKVNVVVTDDFDGSEGAKTVRFGLDGAEYEVDLKPEHEERLRNFLDAYLGVGRKITAASRRSRRLSSTPRTDASGIREWARANGYPINERGRVPKDIMDAYHAAQGGSAPAPAPEPAAELTPEQLDSAPAFSQA